MKIQDINNYELYLNKIKDKYNIHKAIYDFFLIPFYYNFEITIFNYTDIKLLYLLNSIDKNKIIYFLETNKIIIHINKLSQNDRNLLLDFFYINIEHNDIYLKYYINYCNNGKELEYFPIELLHNKTNYNYKLIKYILVNNYNLICNNALMAIGQLNKYQIKKLANKNISDKKFGDIIIYLTQERNPSIYYWLKYLNILLSRRMIKYIYYNFKNNEQICFLLNEYIGKLDNDVLLNLYKILDCF